MPRSSYRAKKLNGIRKMLKKNLLARMFVDSDEDGSMAEFMDLSNATLLHEYQQTSSKRYTNRVSYRKAKSSRIEDDIAVEDAASDVEREWLSDTEYLQKYRMTKDSFNALLNLIKDHDVFRKRRGRQQKSVASQLMVFLRYLGTEGSGGNNPGMRNLFGIGRGTAEVWRKRVTIALRSLRDSAITWPDAEERKLISERVQAEFQWPNCVGLIDGTLFPLLFRPERVDAPDYSGRKHAYSLSVLIVCDDQRLIRYYLSGWPGTAHDNRIFRNSNLANDPTTFFSPLQYLLGDSAFEARDFMIPAYKKPQGMPITRQHEVFNHALGSARVISEHCIGILKGRFPWLRSIPCKLTSDARSMESILELIECCIILHNLLVQRNDHTDPDDWNGDDDDVSDVDSTAQGIEALIGEAQLDQAVPAGSLPGHRRELLCFYMNQVHVL